MLLNYKYEMILDFSQPVTDQHFSIMCLPRDTERQKCIENTVRVTAGYDVPSDSGKERRLSGAALDAAGISSEAGRELANRSAAAGCGQDAVRSRAGTQVQHSCGTDGLGNLFVHGLIREPHSSFCLISEGTVETGGALYEEYEDPASVGLWRYRTESPYTAAGPALKKLWAEWQKSAPGCEEQMKGAGQAAGGPMQRTAPEDEYGTMLHYGNCVQEALSYVSGSTDVATTAEQAVLLGKGVCQDYAHVMIALLRLSGIPARYVIGMIPGEGETHAWVEANCRGYWYGIDPTNNALVNDNYIKFSHGRDYGDCMISRGIFTNPYAVQTTQAGVTVQEVQQ